MTEEFADEIDADAFDQGNGGKGVPGTMHGDGFTDPGLNHDLLKDTV